MKNITIAIIATALMLGLCGCVYNGEPSVGGYYSYGYSYTQLYGGAYYDDYFWPYRYGFNSYWYRHDLHNSGRHPDRVYRHGQSHHDNRPHRWKSQPHRDRRSTGPVYGNDRHGLGKYFGDRGNRSNGRLFRCLSGRC